MLFLAIAMGAIEFDLDRDIPNLAEKVILISGGESTLAFSLSSHARLPPYPRNI